MVHGGIQRHFRHDIYKSWSIFFLRAQQFFGVQYEVSGNSIGQDVGHIVQTRVPHASCVPASPGEPALFTTSLIYFSHMHHVVPDQTAMCCVKLTCSLVLPPVQAPCFPWAYCLTLQSCNGPRPHHPNFRLFPDGSVIPSSLDRPRLLAVMVSLYMMATPHSCAPNSFATYCRTSSFTLRYVASSTLLTDLCQIPSACSSYSSHTGCSAFMCLSNDFPVLYHLPNTCRTMPFVFW